jgi:hypothetical protein
VCKCVQLWTGLAGLMREPTPAHQPYSAGMTDAVTDKKVGAPGASVTLAIKKPDGSTFTATGTTYRVCVTGTRVRDRTLTHADG